MCCFGSNTCHHTLVTHRMSWCYCGYFKVNTRLPGCPSLPHTRVCLGTPSAPEHRVSGGRCAEGNKDLEVYRWKSFDTDGARSRGATRSTIPAQSGCILCCGGIPVLVLISNLSGALSTWVCHFLCSLNYNTIERVKVDVMLACSSELGYYLYYNTHA